MTDCSSSWPTLNVGQCCRWITLRFISKRRKKNRQKGKIALPVFDGRQRDGCPAPQVAQIARLSPNVGRFVVASVARIFFDDTDHQISNVWAVQVIEESDLKLVGNPSGNEKKGAGRRAAETWIKFRPTKQRVFF